MWKRLKILWLMIIIYIIMHFAFSLNWGNYKEYAEASENDYYFQNLAFYSSGSADLT